MRIALAGLAAALALGAAPAQADPMEDALYIVDHTISRTEYEAAFAGMADLMVGNLQNEFAKGGDSISNAASETAVIMMSAQMADALLDGMRRPLAEAYVYNVSPEALAGYRAFLETPAGQEISASNGVIALESVKIGNELAESIAIPAVNAMIEDMRDGNYPAGTLKSTQRELERLFLEQDPADTPPEL